MIAGSVEIAPEKLAGVVIVGTPEIQLSGLLQRKSPSAFVHTRRLSNQPVSLPLLVDVLVETGKKAGLLKWLSLTSMNVPEKLPNQVLACVPLTVERKRKRPDAVAEPPMSTSDAPENVSFALIVRMRAPVPLVLRRMLKVVEPESVWSLPSNVNVELARTKPPFPVLLMNEPEREMTDEPDATSFVPGFIVIVPLMSCVALVSFPEPV